MDCKAYMDCLEGDKTRKCVTRDDFSVFKSCMSLVSQKGYINDELQIFTPGFRNQ